MAVLGLSSQISYMVSYVFQPEGGINFIRTFQKQKEDQGFNLPPNLAELVINANYSQSPDSFMWRYFYDLKGIVCYFVKAFYFLAKYLYMYDYIGVLD